MIEIRNQKELKNFLTNYLKFPKTLLIDFEDASDINTMIDEMLKILVNEMGLNGIYLSLRTPATYIIEILKKSGINPEKILFIDAISNYFYSPAPGISLAKSEGATSIKKDENIIFLSSPSNLAEIAIVFYEILASVKNPEKVFIVIDSLDIIALHSEKEKFLKFVHFVSSKLKIFRVLGFYFRLIREEEDILKNIIVFVDEIVKIKLSNK